MDNGNELTPAQLVELSDLGAMAVALRAEIAERQEQLDAINARARELASEGAYQLPNGGRLTLSPNHRFDARRFAERYPFHSFPELYEPAPARAAIKARLSPEQYEACMSEPGAPRVTWQ